MRRLTSFVAACLLASIVATTLNACNTVKGVGRDVESVGEAGSDAMKKHR